MNKTLSTEQVFEIKKQAGLIQILEENNDFVIYYELNSYVGMCHSRHTRIFKIKNKDIEEIKITQPMNCIERIEGLEECKKLKSFTFWYSNISEISFRGLENLEVINMYDNVNLTNIEFVNCSKLKYIRVEKSNLKGWINFNGTENIKHLELCDNSITTLCDSCVFEKTFKNTVIIDLTNNKFKYFDISKEYCDNEFILEKLKLNGNSIYNIDLSACPKLEDLYIENIDKEEIVVADNVNVDEILYY